MEFLTNEKFVVLDFETTGNRMTTDEIIQIGLSVIQHGDTQETYSTFVKPTIPIPPFIEQLTGISDVVVENAPALEDVLPEVLKRLDGGILVAHNVHFDLSVLQHALEKQGYNRFKGTILDTVEMSRILLPKQSSYKLTQLSDQLDMTHEQPHQADSDAKATAQLFVSLCQKLWSLPLVTIQRMIPLSRTLRSDIDSLLRAIEAEKIRKQHDTNLTQTYTYRQLALRKDDRDTELDPNDQRNQQRDAQPFYGDQDESTVLSMVESRKENAVQFEHWLSNAMPDYESRAGQQQFFSAVSECFSSGKHGLYEVGTGTGKTMAYLMASVIWSKIKGEKVVISTHTIPLQEQIMDREVPLLRDILPLSFSATLMKGKHHYLCLQKFEQALLEQQERNYDHDLTKLQILVWLTETSTGDVEELNLPSGGKDFWQLVKSEGSSCFNRECPWFKKCFYYRTKQRAQEANLIITNHALLLSDITHGQGLPAYQYALIDEAHHFEHVATEQYGRRIAYAAIYQCLQRLAGEDRKSLSAQMYMAFQTLYAGEDCAKRLDEIIFEMGQMKQEVDQLFDHVFTFCEQKKVAPYEGNQKQIRVEHQKESGDEWLRILQETEKLSEHAEHLCMLNQRMIHKLEEHPDLTYTQKQRTREWHASIQQLEEHLGELRHFFLECDAEHEVYWIDYDRKGNRYYTTLQQRPIYVDDTLREDFFSKKESVVLTSATLQVRQRFDYMLNQLGLDETESLTGVIHSPFDYEQQASVLVVEDMSEMKAQNEREFMMDLADSLVQMATVSQGRMLVLFTSYKMLRGVHHLVKDRLQEQGIFLYAQGVDSGSRTKLAKNFQKQEKSVLFGTYSFWEGIDIPGEALSCLVIVKLPFAPPHSPFDQAKAELLKKNGFNPFMDYALPQAVLRFKQGFGRLIRKATDRGVVVVFDQRMIKARYGKYFLHSLPPVEVLAVSRATLVTEIEQRLGEIFTC